MFYIIGAGLLVFGLLLYALFPHFIPFTPSEVVGVQILTPRGTVLVGRSGYAKNLDVWLSPEIGWFDKAGKPNFFHFKRKREKIARDNWEIVWEWDELYLHESKDALVKFAPTQEEKDSAIETLSSLCSNKSDLSLSCQWNVSNRIFIESLTDGYLCLSDLASEFYGGAHPIALRRFGTYDYKNKKFVRLDDFIQSDEVKNQIWKQLYENIQAVTSQTMLSDNLLDTNSSGGVDLQQAPEGVQDNAQENANPQHKLTGLLNSLGYTFNANVFCPAIRPDGPLLLFGFPHSEQVNRGLNFRAEALLNQPRLPQKVVNLFADYRFAKPEGSLGTILISPDRGWKVYNDLDGLVVQTKGKKLTLKLPESDESSEELLGIFWIYKSPNSPLLKELKFKKVSRVSSHRKLELAKAFGSKPNK